jgi:hypothetical protein
MRQKRNFDARVIGPLATSAILKFVECLLRRPHQIVDAASAVVVVVEDEIVRPSSGFYGSGNAARSNSCTAIAGNCGECIREEEPPYSH